jgi:hypothetical protein
MLVGQQLRPRRGRHGEHAADEDTPELHTNSLTPIESAVGSEHPCSYLIIVRTLRWDQNRPEDLLNYMVEIRSRRLLIARFD